MAWLNEEVAGLLREYAELTQITGGDVFRARNYEKAARSVRGWGDDIGPLDAKALRAIPGVGASIAAKIAEYRATGAIGALRLCPLLIAGREGLFAAPVEVPRQASPGDRLVGLLGRSPEQPPPAQALVTGE